MENNENPWVTRQSLILRAKDPDDELAWKDFDNYYRPFITLIVRKLNVSTSDRDDLTQDVLLKVWKSLKKMEVGKNNAKFRTWLSLIIRNTVIDFYKTDKKNKSVSIEEKELEFSVPDDIETMIEEEWRTHVSDLAMKRVSKYFNGNAIEVFTLSYAGESTQDISKKLGIKEDTVYVLKNRVKNKVIEEIKILKQELELE